MTGSEWQGDSVAERERNEDRKIWGFLEMELNLPRGKIRDSKTKTMIDFSRSREGGERGEGGRGMHMRGI